MFGNLGFPEILIIMVIILLLFGAKRIPEIAGSMGKGIREFKKHISEANGPDSPAENSALSRSVINERASGTSTAVSRTSLPESNERGEPKRLLD